jgi:hypothetical protein
MPAIPVDTAILLTKTDTGAGFSCFRSNILVSHHDVQRHAPTANSIFESAVELLPQSDDPSSYPGSPSERFIRAKQRASVVQIYINKRFGLQPNTVGVMPMSDSIPPSVGKSVWDGVSLVLIR